jgi:hypothetical protein
MNPKTKFGEFFLAVFILGMGLMLCPNNTAAFSLRSSDIEQILHSETKFKINALVMEVNLKKAYIVVGEKKIYFMNFKSGGKHYKTAFLNERGDSSYAASLIASQWEGKRVLVKAYKLDSGNLVADSIQKVKLRHR